MDSVGIGVGVNLSGGTVTKKKTAAHLISNETKTSLTGFSLVVSFTI